MGPVSVSDLIRDVDRTYHGREGFEAVAVRTVLGRLAAQGYVRSDLASASSEEEATVVPLKRASRYLEDLALRSRPSFIPPSAGAEPIVRPRGPSASGIPAAPAAREFRLSLAALEARASKLPPQERERVLREYAAGLEAQLDWTNRLIRETRRAELSSRRRLT